MDYLDFLTRDICNTRWILSEQILESIHVQLIARGFTFADVHDFQILIPREGALYINFGLSPNPISNPF